MKLAKILILTAALLSPLTAMAAEERTEAAQSVESLRLQLLEVESKEAALAARARQIDEDLKPENIERSLAGIGSTRPEDLRELRRRQLTIDKDSVSAQLKLLARGRERLESVLRTAETRAYQQSAQEVTGATNQTLMAQNSGNWRWALGILVAIDAIAVVLLVMLILRRQKLA